MRRFTALAIGLIWHASACAAPVWVQTQVSATFATAGAGTTFNLSLAHAFTAGNSLGGLFFYETNTGTNLLSTITDNAGNTYTILDTVADVSSANNLVISFGKIGVTGSPTTLTFTFSSAPPNGNQFVDAEEISGAGVIDAHIQGVNSVATNTPTSGNATTHAADLVLGLYAPATGSAPTAGSGYTLRNADATNGLWSETGSPAQGTVSATFSQSPTAGTGVISLIALSSACGSRPLIGVGC